MKQTFNVLLFWVCLLSCASVLADKTDIGPESIVISKSGKGSSFVVVSTDGTNAVVRPIFIDYLKAMVGGLPMRLWTHPVATIRVDNFAVLAEESKLPLTDLRRVVMDVADGRVFFRNIAPSDIADPENDLLQFVWFLTPYFVSKL